MHDGSGPRPLRPVEPGVPKNAKERGQVASARNLTGYPQRLRLFRRSKSRTCGRLEARCDRSQEQRVLDSPAEFLEPRFYGSQQVLILALVSGVEPALETFRQFRRKRQRMRVAPQNTEVLLETRLLDWMRPLGECSELPAAERFRPARIRRDD